MGVWAIGTLGGEWRGRLWGADKWAGGGWGKGRAQVSCDILGYPANHSSTSLFGSVGSVHPAGTERVCMVIM